MDQVEADHKFVRSLVDWAERGTPKRVADKIGAAPSTINRHYNGTATTKLGRDTLDRLKAAYPGFPGWAARGGAVRSEVGEFGDRPLDEKFGKSNLAMVPLVGSAMGAHSFDPDRDIELTELDRSEVLDQVARPASLARDETAYALTVIGDSMSPKYDPGTRIIVSPKAAININDYVIVQLKGVDPEDQYEERITTVLIKRLVRRSATFIELHQFNPAETFRVDTARVAAMHKVVGEVF